jgi:hypothetical protein
MSQKEATTLEHQLLMNNLIFLQTLANCHQSQQKLDETDQICILNCLSSAWGMGTERYMNGSKVTDTCRHSEQTTCGITSNSEIP